MQIFELHPTEFRIVRRVYAQSARWDGRPGCSRTAGFARSSTTASRPTSPITTPFELYYRRRPKTSRPRCESPDQMTYAELRRYIDTIRRSGYSRGAADREALHEDVVAGAEPGHGAHRAALCVPYREARRPLRHRHRAGPRHHLLDGLRDLHQVWGSREPPPDASAWSANILFSIAAIYMFLNVET